MAGNTHNTHFYHFLSACMCVIDVKIKADDKWLMKDGSCHGGGGGSTNMRRDERDNEDGGRGGRGGKKNKSKHHGKLRPNKEERRRKNVGFTS